MGKTAWLIWGKYLRLHEKPAWPHLRRCRPRRDVAALPFHLLRTTLTLCCARTVAYYEPHASAAADDEFARELLAGDLQLGWRCCQETTATSIRLSRGWRGDEALRLICEGLDQVLVQRTEDHRPVGTGRQKAGSISALRGASSHYRGNP